MEIGKFSEMEAYLVVSAIVGFILPYVTALLNHRRMSDGARIAVAAFVAFAAAVMQAILMGKKEWTDVATAFAFIYPLSQTFYRNVAMKLGARALENASSPESLRDREDDKPLPASSVLEAARAIEEAKSEGKVALSPEDGKGGHSSEKNKDEGKGSEAERDDHS
jgi:hypothetical protein